jgi:hypothetical protein
VLNGIGIGILHQGPLLWLRDLACRNSLRGIPVVHPSDQDLVLNLSTQAAIDLNARGFEESNKAVKARPHIGCL